MSKPQLPSIVGFAGAAGSGKSTARRVLERLGYQPLAFADQLKRVCLSVYGPLGAEERHFFGTQADKAEPIAVLGGVTGREILERVGTEGFRAVTPDVWVRFALATRNPRGRYVLEDCRFQNEVDAVRHAGGCVITLERRDLPGPPYRDNQGALSDGGEYVHPSARWWELRTDALWDFPGFASAAAFEEAFRGRLHALFAIGDATALSRPFVQMGARVRE